MDEKRVEEWAVAWISERIDPERWCYHHLGHVRMFVEDVTEFGLASGVSDRELALLRAAGWLHDIGYAVDPANHEEVSARMAPEVIAAAGGTPEEAAQVAALIRATRLAGRPANLLEELMRDADLGGLGSDGFLERSLQFRRELEQGGRRFSDLEFWQMEAGFLNSVAYFTRAAQELRGPGLERNRRWIADKVRSLKEKEEEQKL